MRSRAARRSAGEGDNGGSADVAAAGGAAAEFAAGGGLSLQEAAAKAAVATINALETAICFPLVVSS